jgi:hypothetical protein
LLGKSKFRLIYFSAGYSFFDSGEVELLGRRKKTPYADVGLCLHVVFVACQWS